MNKTLVLHVPYTWFPDPCGGTEVYVRALAHRLVDVDCDSIIAAPGREAAAYEESGLRVHRFAVDPRPDVRRAWGEPDDVAARGFRKIVQDVRPSVVHLHARTSAVSGRLVGIAHDAGARVVFTYHTPTVTCVRGTMMLFGSNPCDGLLDLSRCISCKFDDLGAPSALAATPLSVSRFAARVANSSKVCAALAVPAMIDSTHRNFAKLVHDVDHIVAVCEWVQQVLLNNGVPPGKLTLSRQGVPIHAKPECRPSGLGSRPLRVAYFGRVDPTKGVDMLPRALECAPGLAVEIDIYGVGAGNEPAFAQLERFARSDSRLRLLPPVPSRDVVTTMACYDLVAIPSCWLETGPLVALEAFAAGVPVIGAQRGGIAELVSHGVNGLLVKPGDPRAWAEALEAIAIDRNLLNLLRSGVKKPRTMGDCAAEMANIYTRLRAAAHAGIAI